MFVSRLSATAWEPDPEVGGELHVLCGGLGAESGLSRFTEATEPVRRPSPAGRLFWSWKARRESRLTMDRC